MGAHAPPGAVRSSLELAMLQPNFITELLHALIFVCGFFGILAIGCVVSPLLDTKEEKEQKRRLRIRT